MRTLKYIMDARYPSSRHCSYWRHLFESSFVLRRTRILCFSPPHTTARLRTWKCAFFFFCFIYSQVRVSSHLTIIIIIVIIISTGHYIPPHCFQANNKNIGQRYLCARTPHDTQRWAYFAQCVNRKGIFTPLYQWRSGFTYTLRHLAFACRPCIAEF